MPASVTAVLSGKPPGRGTGTSTSEQAEPFLRAGEADEPEAPGTEITPAPSVVAIDPAGFTPSPVNAPLLRNQIDALDDRPTKQLTLADQLAPRPAPAQGVPKPLRRQIRQRRL